MAFAKASAVLFCSFYLKASFTPDGLRQMVDVGRVMQSCCARVCLGLGRGVGVTWNASLVGNGVGIVVEDLWNMFLRRSSSFLGTMTSAVLILST